MFTPPPSPRLPNSKQVAPVSDPTSSLLSPPQPTHAMSSHDRKRLTGRRFRWAVLIVPLVLVFITASTRYVTHPSALDVFSDPPSDWSHFLQQAKNWRPHKRHPSPEPQLALSRSSPSSTISSSLLPTSSSAISSSLLPSPTPSRTTTISISQPIPTIPSVPPTLPTPFPQPFDPQLTLNFSSVTCLSFFTNMTQSTAFRPCRPFSLLSQTSADFINAQSNLTFMNTLVWGTCNINPGVNQCIANLGWFAQTLETACAEDLTDGNILAVETRTALNAYKIVYDAACLEDPTSNTYCYINAVANSDPADLYLYQLPLGTPLPRTIQTLTCSPCSKSVLGLYAQALSNTTLEGGLTGLKATYERGARLANDDCGGDYARTGVVNGAMRPKSSASFAVALAAMLGIWSFIL